MPAGSRATAAPYASATLAPAEPTPAARVRRRRDVATASCRCASGRSGEIVSCLDADGAEHSAGGLVAHRAAPRPYVWPFNAWDIDQKYLQRTPAHPAAATPRDDHRRADGRATAGVPFAPGDRRAARHARGGQRRGAVRHRRSSGTSRHRMLRAEFRPARVGETALCEIQFGHIERVMTENTPVETAQFEVAAHKWIATAGRRRRVRAAQRLQVRAPRQERADQPQPAARTDLPRPDGRPRIARVHATRSPRSPPATWRR